MLKLKYASLIAVLLASTTFALAPEEDPLPANNKCCKPATAVQPAAGTCPAPPCAEDMICTPSMVTTSWAPGGCKVEEKKNCLEFVANIPKPEFICVIIACPDGTPTFTCGWTPTGNPDSPKQAVKSCNGQPCSA